MVVGRALAAVTCAGLLAACSGGDAAVGGTPIWLGEPEAWAVDEVMTAELLVVGGADGTYQACVPVENREACIFYVNLDDVRDADRRVALESGSVYRVTTQELVVEPERGGESGAPGVAPLSETAGGGTAVGALVEAVAVAGQAQSEAAGLIDGNGEGESELLLAASESAFVNGYLLTTGFWVWAPLPAESEERLERELGLEVVPVWVPVGRQ